jgi:hypothetical protein
MSSEKEPKSALLEEQEQQQQQILLNITEPILKYTKVSNLPPSIFKDPISACLSTDSFLVFGAHSGVIHVTKLDFTIIRTYRAHKASVLGLSSDGTYIGSASLDGTVAVTSILDKSDVLVKDFKRPVHSIALDPEYSVTKSFISGGTAGEVVLTERGWLGNLVDTVLDSGEDPVVSIYWIEDVIIWMNGMGVSVYGKFNKQLLLNLPIPVGGEGCRPRICVPERNRLYIGWAGKVWNLKIEISKHRRGRRESGIVGGGSGKGLLSSGASMVFSAASSLISNSVDQTITVEAELDMNLLVAGIASFRDSIMVLSYPGLSRDSEQKDALTPRIQLLDSTGVITYTDTSLKLKDTQRLRPNDYHLLQFAETTSASKFLIISANEIVIAKERDLGNKIEWLLENGAYGEAWLFSANYGPSYDRYQIGISWVLDLISKGNWLKALNTLSMIQNTFIDTYSEDMALDERIEQSIQSWNKFGWKFIDHGKYITETAELLPAISSETNDRAIYDAILVHYIDELDLENLIRYLKKWDTKLYHFDTIKTYLEDILKQNPAEEQLRRTLISLYLQLEDYLAAATHLLYLKDPSVLELVQRHNLFHDLLRKIPELLTLNLSHEDDLLLSPLPILKDTLSAAITAVAHARNSVLPQQVVDELLKRGDSVRVVIFLYLERLTLIDPLVCKQFDDLRFELFSEFDRSKLLHFLKSATRRSAAAGDNNPDTENSLDYNKAIQICEANDYTPELIYLLEQTGKMRQALNIILTRLKDTEQAIAFAKVHHQERKLWDDLITYCMAHTRFLRLLTEQTVGYLTPAEIIMRIPPRTGVKDLKQLLAGAFAAQERAVCVHRGILALVKRDTLEITNTLRKLRHSGSCVDPDSDAEVAMVTRALGVGETIVVLPSGELRTESELLAPVTCSEQDDSNAETNQADVWPGLEDWYACGYGSRSVGQKVKHLAYIKSKLAALLVTPI